jgi:hypothetical protein
MRQLREIRATIVVEHDQLTIEDKSLGRNGRERRGYVLIPAADVITVSVHRRAGP